MKESPILFSAPMVRAILDDRKTKTRRVVKSFAGSTRPLVNLREHGASETASGRFNDPFSWGFPFVEDGVNDISLGGWPELWKYQKGDRLWVRESGALLTMHDGFGLFRHDVPATEHTGHYWSQKNGGHGASYNAHGCTRKGFLSGPRTKVVPSIHMPRWACRLQLEIVEVGVERLQDITEEDVYAEGIPRDTTGNDFCKADPILGFRHLWDGINGKKYPWDANPWVWVVEFKRIDARAVAA